LSTPHVVSLLDSASTSLKLFFDQGTPSPLRRHLAGHMVETAFEKGWSTLENGQLLKRVEAEFDVLVTTDQSLRYQRDLGASRLAVLVLKTTSWPRIQREVSRVVDALASLKAGEYRELTLSG
jgi:hypothetical protein